MIVASNIFVAIDNDNKIISYSLDEQNITSAHFPRTIQALALVAQYSKLCII